MFHPGDEKQLTPQKKWGKLLCVCYGLRSCTQAVTWGSWCAASCCSNLTRNLHFVSLSWADGFHSGTYRFTQLLLGRCNDASIALAAARVSRLPTSPLTSTCQGAGQHGVGCPCNVQPRGTHGSCWHCLHSMQPSLVQPTWHAAHSHLGLLHGDLFMYPHL